MMNDTLAAGAAPKQRRGRPFEPGQSGNPRGKAPGTRNRASVLLDAIGAEDLTAIVEKVVAKAKDGDLTAAKMILDRLTPTPRARAVEFDLPAIGKDTWNVADQVIAALGKIAAAAADGTISPSEAVELVAVVDAQRKAVEEMRPDRLNSKPTPKQVEADRLHRRRTAELLNLSPLFRGPD
jgi:hypothetical protein